MLPQTPFNFPEIPEIEKHCSEKNLTLFSVLKPKKIIQCLAEACPDMISEGHIVNMDYKVSNKKLT